MIDMIYRTCEGIKLGNPHITSLSILTGLYLVWRSSLVMAACLLISLKGNQDQQDVFM